MAHVSQRSFVCNTLVSGVVNGKTMVMGNIVITVLTREPSASRSHCIAASKLYFTPPQKEQRQKRKRQKKRGRRERREESKEGREEWE